MIGSHEHVADVLHCGDKMFVCKVEERLCVLQPRIQVRVQVKVQVRVQVMGGAVTLTSQVAQVAFQAWLEVNQSRSRLKGKVITLLHSL